MSEIADLAAARAARAEATVKSELGRLDRPLTVEEKFVVVTATISTLQMAALELYRRVEALEKKEAPK